MTDMIGKQFGYLTVLRRGDDYHSKTGKAYTTWVCRCVCGAEKTVMQCSLVTGHTTSCGCYRKSKMKEEKTVHGGVGSKLYNSWRAMRDRCTNPHSGNYEFYGGRGISVCDEWSEFSDFREWALNNGYVDGLSIDRVDVNGPYSPDNCRWASKVMQCNNKRNNRNITIDNETHTLSEWSRISGINKGTILSRIDKYGWDVKRAVFQRSKTNIIS